MFNCSPPTRRTSSARTDFVSSVYGEGGTYHMDAIELALKMKPDVIFLLTDGEPKDDPPPYQLERIRQLNKGRAKINVIQFCMGERYEGALAKLAKENGGKHVFFNISNLGPGLPGAPGASGRRPAAAEEPRRHAAALVAAGRFCLLSCAACAGRITPALSFDIEAPMVRAAAFVLCAFVALSVQAAEPGRPRSSCWS